MTTAIITIIVTITIIIEIIIQEPITTITTGTDIDREAEVMIMATTEMETTENKGDNRDVGVKKDNLTEEMNKGNLCRHSEGQRQVTDPTGLSRRKTRMGSENK